VDPERKFPDVTELRAADRLRPLCARCFDRDAHMCERLASGYSEPLSSYGPEDCCACEACHGKTSPLDERLSAFYAMASTLDAEAVVAVMVRIGIPIGIAREAIDRMWDETADMAPCPPGKFSSLLAGLSRSHAVMAQYLRDAGY